MSRFAHKLCCFIPLFLAIATFNHAMFRGTNGSLAWIEDKVALIHHSGKAAIVSHEVFGALSYHQRRALDPEIHPDAVALGSSRSDYIRSKYMGGKTLYNCSVNAGQLDDFIDFYTRFATKKSTPHEFIVEASPFSLPQPLEKVLPRIQESLARIGLDMDFNRLVKEPATHFAPAAPAEIEWQTQVQMHFSPTYFQHALDGLYQNSLVEPLSGSSLSVSEHVVFVDGSREYSARMRDKPQAAVREFVNYHIGISMPKPFESCPEESKRAYEGFLDLLLARGERVTLYLPPYHPMFFEAAHKDGKDCLIKFEAYFRSLAQARGIPVIGGYDPAKTGCTEDDLFDFHHPRESGMDKVFKDFKP